MAEVPRQRARIAWQPVWTRHIESWSAKQVRLNLWRFDRTDEFDDVMQDARLLFFTLSKKYPIVNEAAHFFAIYKTSLFRMFTDKSRVKHKSPIDQGVCAEDMVEGVQSTLPNLGHLYLLMEEMPDELMVVLSHLTTGRVRLKLDRPTKTLRRRENHNMRLRRRFSLTTKDPVGDLRSYFVNS